MYAGKLLTWQDMLFVAAVGMVALVALAGGVGCVQGTSAADKVSADRDVTVAGFLLWGTVAIALVAGLVGVYLHASLVEVGRMGAYFAIFWLAAVLGREAGFARLLRWSLVAGGVIAAVWGVREYVFTVVFSGDVNWRIFGPFNNPNSLAGYLVVLLPAAITTLWCGMRERQGSGLRWEAVGGVIALLMVGSALLLTGSKGGIAAAVLALVVYALYAPQPGSVASRTARRMAAAGLVGILALGVVVPPLRARLVSAFSTQAHSAAFRWYTWLGTVEMIRARPLLGFGPGTFEYAYPRYARAGFTQMAHQSYLQWAAEMGVLAALLMVCALAVVGWGLWRRLRRAEAAGRLVAAAALAGLCGFAAHNLVDYSWYVSATGATLWALLGLVLAKQTPPAGGRMRKAGTALAVTVALAAVMLAGVGLRAQGIAADAGRLVKRGLYATAIRRYEQAVRCDPLDADLWVQLARIQQAVGESGNQSQLVAAVNSRLQAAKLRPTQPDNYYRLGQLYQRMGNLTSAIEATRQAIACQPLYPKALAALGRLYVLAGEDAKALEAYRRLVAIYDSPYRKAHALQMMGEYSYVEGWLFLGKRKLAAGDRSEAEELLSLAARELARQLFELKTNEKLLKLMGAWNPESVMRARSMAREVLRLLEGTGDQLTKLRLAALWAALGRADLARRLAAGNALLDAAAPRPGGWEEEDGQLLRKLKKALAAGNAGGAAHSRHGRKENES